MFKKKTVSPWIRLRGVRQNNLKNFNLDLPLGKLIVVTGLSGSGKSSLAFDTLFAEGQRRYVETFSPYARQFLDRMDKPQVDGIEGIPPAIAIEQRNSVKSTRSTVGTITEICDYAKLLWSNLAQLYCRQCGRPVQKDSPRQIWEGLLKHPPENATQGIITFQLPLSDKLSLDESLALISHQGYQRLLLDKRLLRLDEARPLLASQGARSLTVVQDRLSLNPSSRARFIEACEQAYHFGKGKLTIQFPAIDSPAQKTIPPLLFSNRLHCATCDLDYRPSTPALFSFNHPLGACPACRGFGRIITIDYNLALPDRRKTLAEGAIKPWLTGHGLESHQDLMKFCKLRKVPIHVPFEKLPADLQQWVIEGDPGYGTDPAHEWPRAWYGVKGYFRWLESKAYKMHIRVLLSRYRSYAPCPQCGGKRFQPETLLYRVTLPADPSATAHSLPAHLDLAGFYELSIEDALRFVTLLAGKKKKSSPSDPLVLALHEVASRLEYLNDSGLGYLTLNRPTRSLSGGETERVNLTTCLGSRLVNTLFVLDEPSVGLHARDTERLISILQRLRDAGNTVLVVEHESSVMRAADEIVDLGPGHGEAGGHVVFQGSYPEILKSRGSLTGEYLSGRRKIEIPSRRPVPRGSPLLEISGARIHNLKNLSIAIPLQRLVCITGVSGSGKTTLLRDVLLPALDKKFRASPPPSVAAADGETDEDIVPSEIESADAAEIRGWEHLGRAVLVDQAPIGRTPRSNPAVYTGAFDDIRELFAQSEMARQRGLNSSAFSFNSAQGQCERCRGAGFEKIEMQFLSDVFVRCPDCNGRRYRGHILEIKVAKKSIADLLDSTLDETVAFLGSYDSPAARRASHALELLQEVGLGYLRLGQPINTLSGGESQRLKLARHLAESSAAAERAKTVPTQKPTLFLFDEPTTGLHFEDIRILLKVFHRLVEAGHSVVIIEHNLDVIKSCDWLIDLGPGAGVHGGTLVAAGTPEDIAVCVASQTGIALQKIMGRSSRKRNQPRTPRRVSA